MRRLTTLFLNVSFLAMAWGQAGNDHCDNAFPIPLEPPPACQEAGSFTTSISGTNQGATPSTPYIILNDYFGSGQELGAPVADVWFSLLPAANRLSIQLVGELEEPILVLFQADNCNEKTPVALSRGTGILEVIVEPGQPYLLLVSGASLSDQGPFTLNVESFKDCSTCGQRQGILQASPAPVNGSYEAGQTVQFCYEVTNWDPGNSLEWLHSIQVAFAPGWDLSTLAPSPPSACSAPAGQWAWYDSWESCMSGAVFGPGFAYDSSLGLLCPGGNTLDGNPGNNFGDGPCGTLFSGPLPLQFCWTVQVSNNFSNTEESNLNLEITLLGDGNSGSWMPFSCPPAPATHFLATAAPAASLMPAIDILQSPCISSCDGVLTISGNLSSDWAYNLLNETGNTIFSTNAQAGAFTLAGLCAGRYRLNITNNSLHFTQSALVELAPHPFPSIQLDYLPSCTAGAPGRVLNETTNASGPVSYFWTGPENFFSSAASPEISLPGTYTLHPFSNNCQGEPLNIEIPSTTPDITCETGSSHIIFNWEPLPQDTAYVMLVLSGQSGDWLTPHSYRVQGLAPGEAVDIELSSYGDGLCPLAITEASCQAWPCQTTAIANDTVICPGGQAQLWVEAPTSSAISWSPSAALSCGDCLNPVAQPDSTTTFSATITDSLGCTSIQEMTVSISSLPPDVLPDEPLLFCPGQAFRICLPPENNYLWTSPIGFITTGSCLKFVNPTANIAGLYRIRVRLPGGCQFTETLQLQIDEDCLPGNYGTSELQTPSAPTSAPVGKLSVFPNPAPTQFQAKLPVDGLKKLTLFTAEGRPVIQLETEARQIQIPVSHLPTGAYLLQVISAEGVETRPVAIVR